MKKSAAISSQLRADRTRLRVSRVTRKHKRMLLELYNLDRTKTTAEQSENE